MIPGKAPNHTVRIGVEPKDDNVLPKDESFLIVALKQLSNSISENAEVVADDIKIAIFQLRSGSLIQEVCGLYWKVCLQAINDLRHTYAKLAGESSNEDDSADYANDFAYLGVLQLQITDYGTTAGTNESCVC